MWMDGGHVEPSFSVDLCDQRGNYQSLEMVGNSTSFAFMVVPRRKCGFNNKSEISYEK